MPFVPENKTVEEFLLEQMQRHVQDYKGDDPPLRLAQTAAITAMDKFLEAWEEKGLSPGTIKQYLEETTRMLEILSAFQGKLSLMDCIFNKSEDNDE